MTSFLISMAVGLALLATDTHAQVIISSSYTTGFSNGGVIPDNNPVGWSDTRAISISGNPALTAVQVSLNVSGGYTGDLYGYLSRPGGGFAILLNRVGKTSGDPFGYADTGMNVTFDGAATSDVHLYQTSSYGINGAGQLTGTWQPDGRNTSPFSVTDASTRNATLGSLVHQTPNGNWTLYLADFSAGGQSTVVRWGMQLTAVPEPAEVATVTAVSLLMLAAARHARARNNAAD